MRPSTDAVGGLFFVRALPGPGIVRRPESGGGERQPAGKEKGRDPWIPPPVSGGLRYSGIPAGGILSRGDGSTPAGRCTSLLFAIAQASRTRHWTSPGAPIAANPISTPVSPYCGIDAHCPAGRAPSGTQVIPSFRNIATCAVF